ncbi:MAG: transketolase [Thermosediminibacterales bacterium]|nr:transketolase [Thermosediminibacterales bacterium]
MIKEISEWSMKPGRDGFGEGLLELGEVQPKVVVMDADLSKSTRTNWFAAKYPERFIDMGIAEQDMLATAGGLSMMGLIPYTATYGTFVTGRAWDQIRTTICYGELNVKIAGAHGGISVGADGATHQALEDVALMRAIPNMTVVVPCDAEECKKATIAASEMYGPFYFRFGREATPVITHENTPFKIGRAETFHDGEDITVIANGPMVAEALKAAYILEPQGISVRVVNMHTVKPLDISVIIKAARETKAIITMEEHSIIGGLGGAVAEFVSQNCPVKMKIIGTKDTFGESGQPDELLEAFGLTSEHLIEEIKNILKK